jgi:hypothetical protein
LGETRARTFTNFDRGTVYFRHMRVLVSRICTIFYVFLRSGDFCNTFVHVRYIRYHGEASKNLQNALDVEYGTNSTYEHSQINSSSVKICESSRPRLAQKFSIVTRAVVLQFPNRLISSLFQKTLGDLAACPLAKAAISLARI